jgi:hypothetical protein
MIIKRVVTVFLVYAFIFVLIPSFDIHANSGPPSNLRLTIVNADFDYYLEVLIYQDTPLSSDQIAQAEASEYFTKEENGWYYDYRMIYDMPEMLINFQDKDGYVSYSLFHNDWDLFEYVGNDDGAIPNQFVIWIDPPRQFKLMLIGENNQVILSEVVQMGEYDYRITWDLEGISLSQDIQYDSGLITGLILNPFKRVSTYIDFFFRLFLTLAIELGVLYLFGFRKNKSFLIAFGVNLISQSILTVGTLFSFYLSKNQLFAVVLYYIVGEFFIFGSEMIIYGFALREKPLYIRVIYGFVANLLSMIIGLIATLFIFSRLLI